MKIIILLILAIFLFSACTTIYPDTAETPVLHFRWDYELNESNIKGMGPFGVTESNDEVATELEIHLKKWHDPIYAMTDGIVVEIQEDDTDNQGTVEGVWIKYGKNVLLKYVHVYNITVKEGDIIYVGDIIGYTTKFRDFGFFEVEFRIKEGDKVYAYPFYDFCDKECKQILEPLWNNPDLQYGRNLKIPYKIMDKYDVTEITKDY